MADAPALSKTELASQCDNHVEAINGLRASNYQAAEIRSATDDAVSFVRQNAAALNWAQLIDIGVGLASLAFRNQPQLVSLIQMIAEVVKAKLPTSATA